MYEYEHVCIWLWLLCVDAAVGLSHFKHVLRYYSFAFAALSTPI